MLGVGAELRFLSLGSGIGFSLYWSSKFYAASTRRTRRRPQMARMTKQTRTWDVHSVGWSMFSGFDSFRTVGFGSVQNGR